jgi:hypothetical protein
MNKINHESKYLSYCCPCRIFKTFLSLNFKLEKSLVSKPPKVLMGSSGFSSLSTEGEVNLFDPELNFP